MTSESQHAYYVQAYNYVFNTIASYLFMLGFSYQAQICLAW